MRTIGYARVSTSLQDTTMQLDALERAGVQTVFQEKRSSVGKRPQLDLLLESLKPGDLVKVYKIDRVARSLINLLQILDRIEASGASFQSLTEPVDTSCPAGRMMMQMLGSFAEFERSIIRERSMSGQLAARERGVHCGRPRVLDQGLEIEIVRLYRAGGSTLAGIAATFGVHESTVKRAVYRVSKPGHSSLK